jgi:Rrf2 family transcriptional regulator, cysteine metabolism repressor
MRISVRAEYALQAVFDLATQKPGAPVKIADIARRQKIPQKFLELILATLRQAGIVESRRGADGGYLLAHPAVAITVGEVLRTIDGEKNEKMRSRRGEDSPFVEMWLAADQATSAVIDHANFADLVRNWQEKQNRFVPNWEI